MNGLARGFVSPEPCVGTFLYRNGCSAWAWFCLDATKLTPRGTVASWTLPGTSDASPPHFHQGRMWANVWVSTVASASQHPSTGFDPSPPYPLWPSSALPPFLSFVCRTHLFYFSLGRFQAVLRLTLWPGLALNLESSCVVLLSTEIAGVSPAPPASSEPCVLNKLIMSILLSRCL